MKTTIFSKFRPVIAAGLLSFNSFAQDVRPSIPVGIEAHLSNQLVDSLVSRLNRTYVFEDSAKKAGQFLRSKQKSGAYAAISDPAKLAEALTADLRELTHDKHLTVFYTAGTARTDAASENEKQQAKDISERRRKRMNSGFAKTEILSGNIGYLKVNEFFPSELAAVAANSAMAFLQDTDAMIIDLRDNHGGEPEMVRYLASFFFEQGTHLNDIRYRKNRRVEEFRTLAPPLGNVYSKPVYILTSERTFSAGEEFAYDFQVLKRATLVGQTTRGGANPGEEIALLSGFSVFMPDGYAENPITKTNWEGVGVKPDFATGANEALPAAHEKILEQLLDEAAPADREFYRRQLDKIKTAKR